MLCLLLTSLTPPPQMYIRSFYPELPPIPSTNHHNVIYRSARAQAIPDHVLCICGVTGKQRTRDEFLERVYDAATILGADKELGGVGIQTNGMIGIFSENCLEYLTIIHTSIVLATPFVSFPAYASPPELRHYIQISRPTHVFVHASLLETFLKVARNLGFPEANIFILEGNTHNSKFKSLDQLVNATISLGLPRAPVRDAKKDTLAYLIFSSGTTGLPKAVMISHGNLTASFLQNALQLSEMAKVLPPNYKNDKPTMLGFLPLSHCYGLHVLCLRLPLRANTIVILPKWDLDLVLNVIPKYKITSLFLLPSVMYTLLNSPKLHKTDLSSVVSFISGAAHMPPALVKRMQAVVPKSLPTEGFGMTEVTLSVLLQPFPGILNGRVDFDPTATGILSAGLEVMILRPDGTHCLPDELGELYVKGPTVALGYWENPEATKKTFLPGGWVRTGDRLRANTKGTFWFEDRVKDTLKISGLQVAPSEVENTILVEPSGIVADVAAVGVNLPTARTSDDKALRAWIVLTPKGKSLGEDKARELVDAWTRENLSRHKWLRGGIEFVKEIPKNPTGKVLRRVLREQYESQNQRQQQTLHQAKL